MSSTPDYEAQFRDSIQKSIEFVLARIEQIANTLPRDVEELALHALDFGLKLDEAWPATRKVLLIMAPKMEQAGYRDEWMPFLERGIERAQQHEDIEAEAELRLQLGIILQLRGSYNLAQIQIKSSSDAFTDLNNFQNKARALNRLAYLSRLQHHRERAFSFANEVLSLEEASNVEHAYSNLVLGVIELDNRRYQNAIGFFQKAIYRWESESQSRMSAWGYTNLGVAYLGMAKYALAQNTLKRAINQFEGVRDPVHLAVAKMNLGNVYLSTGEPQKALTFYSDAKYTFEHTHSSPRVAHIHQNIGMALRKLQRYSEAETAYNKSIQQYRDLHIIDRLANAMNGLGLVYNPSCYL